MRAQLHGETVFYGTGSGQPDRTKPAIVFVHGAGFDHSVWGMPARFFARHGYTVLAPDLPGHGRSGGAALTDINAMADWLLDLVKQEVDQPVTMVGHSMGSLITMAFAVRHRIWISKMALLGTSAPMPVGAPLLEAAADNHHAAFDMANAWSHSAQGQLGRAELPGTNNLVSAERWLERMHDGVYFADLAACNNFVTPLEIDAPPALIIAGAADRMTPPKAGMAVAKALPDARTVVLDDCGHAMLAEKPNEVLDALAEFIME